MRIRKSNKGVTIIELLGVMGIMSAMIYMASNFTTGVYRDAKFNDYANKIEYFAKYARIQAIKESSQIGLCIDKKVITLRDMDSGNIANPCSITDSIKIIKTLDLSKEDSIKIISNNTISSTTNPDLNNFVYDSRGLARQTSSTICISNNNKFVKYTINITNITKKSNSEKNDIDDPSGATICQ